MPGTIAGGGKESKVARVSKVAWMGVVAGLALEANAALAAAPMAEGESLPVNQAPALSPAVRSALSSGIDNYRRADYEKAEKYFRLAQSAQEDLTPEERQELVNLIKVNNAALKARREGAALVKQAEAAAQTGQIAEADKLLKTLATNQFLATADKIKAQQLSDQMHSDRSGGSSAGGLGGMESAGMLARSKLQQARQLIFKANYDAAEALAHEVVLMKVTFNGSEDSPMKVLNDISRIRGDTKKLLTSARVALNCGDLERAEHLANAAAKSSSSWSITQYWGDTPAKVLKDIQARRAQMEAITTVPVPPAAKEKSKAASEKPKGTPISNNEAAHFFIKEGRLALKRGDVDKARECCNQAQALDGNFKVWEDNPTKLAMDIAKNDKKTTVVTAENREITGSKMVSAKEEDPKADLKHARELFDAEKLDDAEAIALRVQSTGWKNWGLFDDTPEKLLTDIHHAESVKVLREARSLFDKGEYEGARAKAMQAEKLHGPYGVLELGDRPAKVIAEIDSAMAKNPKKRLPAAPVELTQKDPPPTPPPGSSLAQEEGPALPEMPKGLPTLAQVKPETPAEPPTEKNPFEDLVPGNATASHPAPEVQPVAMPQIPSVPLAGPDLGKDAAKQKAKQLMAQARNLQRDDRLVEARQKVLEAQKTGTVFGAEEERPEQILLELLDTASRRIKHLKEEASDFAATAQGDPSRWQKAEGNLTLARTMALGFALDTHEIDATMNWVRQTRQQMDSGSVAKREAAPPMGDPLQPVQHEVNPAAAPARTALQAGPELLDRARMELKRGELEIARKLAVEVYTGPYGIKEQADALLHSIDAEEFNQKVLVANRSFDAGLAAYLRKDYAQAAVILRSLEPALLAKDKQAKLKELMLSSELHQGAIAQAVSPPPSAEPGKATVSDLPDQPATGPSDQSFAKQVQAMQEVQFQKLRHQGLETERKAMENFRNGDTAPALEMLQEFLNQLKEVNLEPEKVDLLQRPVAARLQQFKKLKAQQDFEKEQVGQKDSFNHMMQREAQLEEHKKKQVTELMKKYRTFYHDGKYAEALVAATQAHELDPDNTETAAAVQLATMQRNYTSYQQIKDRKSDMFVKGLNDAEDEGPAVTSNDPLKFHPETWENAKKRKAFPKDGWGIQIKGEKEREIERRLGFPISLDFKDQPLRSVLEDLRDLTSINIVPDVQAMEAENISLDRPITIHLEGVSTKSALTLILHQAHLVYVIEDEVLKVTTEARRRGNSETRTYQVADLVVPIENHTTGSPLAKAAEQKSALLTNGGTPFLGSNTMKDGATVSSPTKEKSAGSGEPQRSSESAMADALMHLITSTIKPDSWDRMGGPGTIEYYPLGMALVVSQQTPDIQEQVADLLAALRRLQDMEVTVEVRFITLSEEFYERIGIDFNLNIQNQNTKYDPLIVSGQFAPAGFNNVFRPKNFLVGLLPGGSSSPPGAYTSDLNIPIKNSSFGPAIPPFGGFPNALGMDGGLSLGLAFLSDIQVFLFMEAAQSDSRTNVLQAPKLTLFNGQNSTINITDNQWFVTNLTVFQSNGQVVFAPSNTQFAVGINMSIQAVVSADRRFVRLNLAPDLTSLAPAPAALFPITTFITPVFENGAQGQPVPFTQYVQQPNIREIRVETTVMVPDGGTVLLGGLKALREGRNEFGPPILSKIPYISRLFKNVGYGREAESLLIMVTPRIIINEEEEYKQTRVGTGGLGASGETVIGGGVAPGSEK
jgi:type II secretory pathway component GspD/PulD (secretin)/tetratricopeptide (TPR) repeat protein